MIENRMKQQKDWQPSKYVVANNGKLIASRNPEEVSVWSRLVADLTAAWYSENLKTYARGDLLDLGCGKAPLYGVYAQLAKSTTLADWENSPHENKYLDVVCDITKKLPFKDKSFDTVILSDVLEHLPNPSELMSELQRILRPNGRVLINVPFMYHVHEAPHDYHRYTEFMLRKLVQDAGMSVEKLEPLGGIYVVLIDVLSKIWGGRRAAIIQNILPRLYSKRLKARPEFPISYALVCSKAKER